MSRRFNLIAQQLLQKDFEQCTIDELVQYAEAYPFLAPAQFLLVKKLQQQEDPSFKIKAQKAALFYHQPVAFEAFLLADENVFATPAPQMPEPEAQKEIILLEQPAATTLTEIPVVANTVAEPAEVTIETDHVPEVEPADIEPVGTEPMDESSEPAIKMPLLPQMNTAVAADVLTFEPYHTVDYFASQGIKLSQEELPKDKFGKQLMSFTAWLKTMKKLPATEAAKNMDPQAEEKVEHMAAHSVSNPEVVTETMAEVWIKQGQPHKAAEVYHKLSLLYPSKKVYFAAKLQNLKQ